MSKNYYEILEVRRDSKPDEIKSSYRRLAKKYHPDSFRGKNKEEAVKKFRDIHEAYSVLSDPTKRQQYDRFGTVNEQPDVFSGSGFWENLSSFFWGNISGGTRKTGHKTDDYPQIGDDIRTNVKLSLEDICFPNRKKKIRYRKRMACSECNETGLKKGSQKKKCPVCKGKGVFEERTILKGSSYVVNMKICSKCEGTGMYIHEDSKCPSCHGRGEYIKTQQIDYVVPQGIKTGHVIRLRHQGHDGKYGGPSGDLYVVAVIMPHEKFIRSNNNLELVLPITYSEAVLGSVRSVETIYGETKKVNIPKGSKNMSMVSLRGDGCPVSPLQPSVKGNLVIYLEINVPDNLDEEYYDLVNKLMQKEKDLGIIKEG